MHQAANCLLQRSSTQLQTLHSRERVDQSRLQQETLTRDMKIPTTYMNYLRAHYRVQYEIALRCIRFTMLLSDPIQRYRFWVQLRLTTYQHAAAKFKESRIQEASRRPLRKPHFLDAVVAGEDPRRGGLTFATFASL